MSPSTTQWLTNYNQLTTSSWEEKGESLEDYLASKNEDQPLVYKLLNHQSSFLLQVTLQACVMNQEKEQVWSVFLEQK